MSEMNPQSAEPSQNPIRHRNKIPTSKEMNTADTPKSKISASFTRHSAYGANPKSPNCPTLLFASRCPLETL